MVNTQRTKFIDTYIDNLTAYEAKECVNEVIRKPGYHYVVSPNADIILKMHQDREL